MKTAMHWLLDRVANDQNIAPAFTATVFPPRVSHRKFDGGGEYEVAGKNRDAVEAKAEELRGEILGRKSMLTHRPDGVWVQWVTYGVGS